MELNKVLQGDCLEVMKTLPDNSVDTILTDPPYGLSFMGKKWDYDVPSEAIWIEALRVLKPGGTALIFAGSRTQHRMAVRVEDSGFILKDTIMWLYGCLSEDTEVLTSRGWEHLYKITKDDRIKVYDITKNIYKWETPERWSVYSVNKDTCYRIKSDKTDQIVSKEHRCIVEREGKLIFKKAWELSKMERVPVLPQDFYSLEKEDRSLLLLPLFREIKGLAQAIFSKWERKEVSSKGFKDGKEPSVERWSNIFQKEGKLWKIQNKICSLSERLFRYGSERRLCYGTQIAGGTGLEKMLIENRGNTPQRPQSRKQFFGKLNAFFKQQGTQAPRSTRATIEKIEYTGKLFCPTVSTGAFVARRNGKVFITGNSGFPKATDISKQLDKKAGAKRKITGYKSTHINRQNTDNWKKSAQEMKHGAFKTETSNISGGGLTPIAEPATPEAKLWNGWKSHGLKPAYEPILVCMKPNEGTYANNALTYGVSGLNIDGGRIGTEEHLGRPQAKNSAKNRFTKGLGSNRYNDNSNGGRFPANLILDSEAGKMLDEQSGERSAGHFPANQNKHNASSFSVAKGKIADEKWLDKGGASRFFYCAKASKRERNAGCEGLEKKEDKGSIGLHTIGNSPTKDNLRTKTNNHPTVKPLKLMEYLCTLTKTPTRGIVLDPFMGSGTTGIACVNTNRDFIGIEREPEYIKIAEARIKEVEKQKRLKPKTLF